MKKLVVGILAHVDAGKTTLAESILYLTGSIRKFGRVDHKDTFLDTYELERTRGITIFSKQAVFKLQDMEVTLLDTPGHVDFSAEMERTLQILDYAILVINGSDGVQGHTETLWTLLTKYRIPTFLFVNKMDIKENDRHALMEELTNLLSERCMDFDVNQNSDAWYENLAMSDEAVLEYYIENGTIDIKDIAKLIANRKVFPCYFGSALKLQGVEEFLNGLAQYTIQPSYPAEFGAKVFKISRDDQGSRLTHMKITGGSLAVKTLLSNRMHNDIAKQIHTGNDTDNAWEEKVDQIRIYSGTRFEPVDKAEAGTVCAVTGLSKTLPGGGLGMEAGSDTPILQPVLNYQVLLPPEYNAYQMLSKLRQLEEEDPQLHIVWSEQLKEIHVQLMGEVQIEILKSIISERFGVPVEFGPGNIVYKETIAEPVVGVGHFEPLRHYAEVHLLLEPTEPGSGLTFDTICSEDVLDRNWQRLILTHLEEKEHVGVLTGSPITDMKITLLTGRAHQKHTEGGDFRQATYRAVRQGLKKAKSVLLEPYYNFKMEIPSEVVGRAMTDIGRMNGEFNPPEMEGEMSVIIGSAPVATMRGYHTELVAYTKGRGRLYCTLKGYYPCHNAEEVIEAIGYDSERDLDNPTGSVFCAHGAGFVVEWDKVDAYKHLESGWTPVSKEQEATSNLEKPAGNQDFSRSNRNYRSLLEEDKELEEIFVRTFGPIKRKLDYSQGRLGYEKKSTEEKTSIKQKAARKEIEPVEEYLLVDGYNIIFAWDELNELGKVNMDSARYKLMDILCNYQGFKKCNVILVFDAYKVKGNIGEVQEYHNIHVVYTKEAETADQYIEKVSREISKKHRVTVATSDATEQLIILGHGATRLSAKDLKEDIQRIRDQIRRDYLDKPQNGRAYLGEQFNTEIWEFLQ